MKKVFLVAVFLCLSGCATYAPGVDEMGQKLQQEGIPVLVAIRNYMDDTTRQPRTLQDLVPKYLPALPLEPKIDYDFKNSVLTFDYTQGSGVNSMLVECHALVGQVDWVCE